jgi:hypothetical protein
MTINRLLAILGSAVALTLLVIVGLAGAAHPAAHQAPAHRPAAAPAAPAREAPAVTPASLRGPVSDALHALKASDAGLQEAWVSGGHLDQLQAVIDATASANDADTLNVDATAFNSTASGYLSDNDPYLAPGWKSGERDVRDALNTLATDLGLPQVPDTTGSTS